MRADMEYVLIDRPRHGRKLRKLNRMRAKAMAETSPRKQGVRRQRWENGTRTKSFSDHIAPLERYLRKQVGRPWDKVHSDIRARIKPGALLQEHLLEHVRIIVLRPAIGRKGEWIWRHGWSASPREPRDGQLYIHPVDGLLKSWKSKRRDGRGRR